MLIAQNSFVTPIFVVGSPRSGTSLIGNLLGSSSEVCYLDELGAFYFSHFLANEHVFKRMSSPYREEYTLRLQALAAEFCREKAEILKAKSYCDSSPGNLLAAAELAKSYPNALFVLVLRHYSGVIQSLARSFLAGYEWAGKSLEERALLWASYYLNSVYLPSDRTVVVSYDTLCFDPETTLTDFLGQLKKKGLDITLIRQGSLATSHANREVGNRPTIGYINSEGEVALRSMPSYERDSWPSENDYKIKEIIYPIEQILTTLFPNYCRPQNYGARNNSKVQLFNQ
jgi:hypothetical protein